MKTLFAISMIFLMTTFIQAQVNQEWVKTYADANATKSMAFDHAGNVYIGANFFNGTTSSKMMMVLKYDASGNLLQTIKDSTATVLRAMTIDENDNIIMAGRVNASLGILVKYDAGGQLVWTQNVIGFSAYKITSDGNNNLYITGENYAANNGDIVTSKYSANGILLWTATFNGSANAEDSPSQIYYEGGFVYVTGIARVSPNQLTEIITLKYNVTDGNKLWGVLYTHPDKISNTGVDIVVDGNQNVFVLGGAWNKGSKKNTYNPNWVTLKYNSAGILQWANIYDGNATDYWGGTGDFLGNDQSYAIILDQVWNVYAAGTSYTTSTIRSAHYSSQDMTTVKYSTAGTQLWVKTYDDPTHGNDDADFITSDGTNIYETGITRPANSSLNNVTTIKYDASGVQQWLIDYVTGANINTYPANSRMNGSGSIFVSGTSQASSGRNTFLIKYSQGTPPNVAHLITRSIGEETNLNELQLYPNPVQIELKIESTRNNLLGNITVYDVAGSIVYKTFANDSQATIDVHDMPVGIYYLKADQASAIKFVRQ